MENTKDRRLEIVAKLMEMGQALILESNETKDKTVAQLGTFLVFIAGLSFDDADMYNFGQLCSMFSAKILLDGLDRSNSDMTEYLKTKYGSESYEDLIKRINKFRSDKGEPPLA